MGTERDPVLSWSLIYKLSHKSSQREVTDKKSLSAGKEKIRAQISETVTYSGEYQCYLADAHEDT